MNPVVKEKTKISTIGKRINKLGYTLIELLVVIVLIGVILYVAVPKVRDDLLNDSLGVATRHLTGIVKDIRHDAVRDHVDHILQIDLTNNAFWVYKADMTPEKKEEKKRDAYHLPSDIRFIDVEQGREKTMAEGEAWVAFFKQGYVQPTVIHIGKEDRIITIALHPFIQVVKPFEKNIRYRDIFPPMAGQ